MTVCAIDTATRDGSVRRSGFTITADGTYAAGLALGDGGGDAWFPERWTLDGYEPYAVPLPLEQPEEPDTDVVPLTDGRVLVRRRVADRHAFSLLYPTGPGTGELPLGALDRTEGDDHGEGTEAGDPGGLTLLPPSPDGRRAYALVVGPHSSAVWEVAGAAFGPERVAEVAGRCSGGVWLDRTGRFLAVDRERDGVVKAVVVDLERGGEVTPLLQITEESNDRLLLADADSGLLLIRSDAPGHDRLGWGVWGSTRPVRFPECLRPADCTVTPFAVQPGQVLMPESCAVALRLDGAAGTRLGVWRPAGGQLHQRPAPEGWLAGAGLWTREGRLHLPYATEEVPCGVARLAAPMDLPRGAMRLRAAASREAALREAGLPAETPLGEPARAEATPGTGGEVEGDGGEPSAASGTPPWCRPVPLREAPLTERSR